MSCLEAFTQRYIANLKPNGSWFVCFIVHNSRSTLDLHDLYCVNENNNISTYFSTMYNGRALFHSTACMSSLPWENTAIGPPRGHLNRIMPYHYVLLLY